jgi:hypothetical protein
MNRSEETKQKNRRKRKTLRDQLFGGAAQERRLVGTSREKQRQKQGKQLSGDPGVRKLYLAWAYRSCATRRYLASIVEAARNRGNGRGAGQFSQIHMLEGSNHQRLFSR